MSDSLIYFDNACTTFYKPEESIRRFKYSLSNFSHPFSGPSSISLKSLRVLDETRERVARFFNFEISKNILFTYSCTSAIKEVLCNILEPNDHIIVTQMEHDSTVSILEDLKRTRNIEVSYLRIGHKGEFDAELLKGFFKENTKIVFMNYASSVNGTVIPVKNISDIVHSKSCLFALDASQVAGVIPVDIDECGIDVLVTSCHKHLYSQAGLGMILYNDKINFREGLVNIQKTEMPNIHAVCALTGGIDYIENKGIYNIHKYLKDISQFTVLKLKELEEIEVIHAGHSVPVISMRFNGGNTREIASILDDEYNIICSAGMQHSQSAHRNFGTFPEGTLRISFSAMNNVDEVNKFIFALKKILLNI
ncbi:MAG: aminotransferase class V-fold PLP-dependent enzyme [Candidatus Muirbacterium halophilum]|nr:aminotransferase class V-fold PLP-dependent enzyme [Candidatus Muirbacterium halophilum]MCK9476288.1 aminotransferase class V-fold PLP-dependent enzyme [Candidatus Muirbacterium halophilum]